MMLKIESAAFCLVGGRTLQMEVSLPFIEVSGHV